MRESGAAGGQREGDVGGARAGGRPEVRQEAGGLGAQRCLRAGGEHPGGEGGVRDGRCARGAGVGGRALCPVGTVALDGLVVGLFENDVGVGPADAEGGHAGPAGAAGLGPVDGLGEEFDGAGRPVDVRGGVSTWRVAGSRPCRIAMTILMTPATPAAAWACPMLDLMPPRSSGRPSGRLRPYVARRAWASMGSPRVVPVPWASTASTWSAVRRASASAASMTRRWRGRWGP